VIKAKARERIFFIQKVKFTRNTTKEIFRRKTFTLTA
jgi:hypothetical protein